MLKKLNKKGFTLAELLVVVAIIAILVAVSIPVFTSKLEASREATDIANMRAAKAAITVEYLDNGEAITKTYYDAAAGKFVGTTKPTGYGEGTTTAGDQTYSEYTNTKSYDGLAIFATVDKDGNIKLDWD